MYAYIGWFLRPSLPPPSPDPRPAPASDGPAPPPRRPGSGSCPTARRWSFRPRGAAAPARLVSDCFCDGGFFFEHAHIWHLRGARVGNGLDTRSCTLEGNQIGDWFSCLENGLEADFWWIHPWKINEETESDVRIRAPTRSSSREARTRVARLFSVSSILVGEPSPQKRVRPRLL